MNLKEISKRSRYQFLWSVIATTSARTGDADLGIAADTDTYTSSIDNPPSGMLHKALYVRGLYQKTV